LRRETANEWPSVRPVKAVSARVSIGGQRQADIFAEQPSPNVTIFPFVKDRTTGIARLSQVFCGNFPHEVIHTWDVIV
jgi:hypothetical protein